MTGVQTCALPIWLPLERLEDFRAGLLSWLEDQAPDLCRRIDQTGLLSGEDREELLDLSRAFLAEFQTPERRGG